MPKQQQQISSAAAFLYQAWLEALPADEPQSVVNWAEQHVKLAGVSSVYDASISPWTVPLLGHVRDGTRRVTFVKPIQSGGTTVGEIAILYALAHWSAGDICAYWQNDLAADERWKKQTENKIRNCAPVMARTSKDRFKFQNGLVSFPHCNFVQQGVFSQRSVASDSFRLVVAEEVHDAEGWLPGRLEQVFGRQTAYWNSLAYVISNAGFVGDQLHQSFEQGTKQFWQVLCPGCGKFHTMRTRWKEEEAHLGGLRYDADGCRYPDGTYNYNKLAPTIRYQMPCEFVVRDNVAERRTLSLSGRYSDPTNPGASLTHRSYSLEAVSVDYIPWIDLIRQKHLAIRAKKLGDPTAWFTYRRERECQFIDPTKDRIESKPIILSSAPKRREGLRNRELRLAALDWQQGFGEDQKHFWLLIVDVDADNNALVVYEGRRDNESEVLAALKEHDVFPNCVLCDSSFDAKYIYSACLRNGWNAIKAAGDRTFTHADGAKRVFSQPQPLWQIDSRLEPVAGFEVEPEYWLVSQTGALDRLAYWRQAVRWEIPSDVSEDFKTHFKAWSQEEVRVPATNQTEFRWKKISEKAPDHLYIAASYIAVWLELLGPAVPEIEENPSDQAQPA